MPFRLLLEEASNIVTLDCKFWTPVASPKHQFVLPSYKRRQTRGAEDAEERRESFKKIFDQNGWGAELKSGPGSSLTGKVLIHRKAL